ncbi:MAG: hypothetical protein RLZZ490_1037 [Cyanobacteriota bacterium]
MMVWVALSTIAVANGRETGETGMIPEDLAAPYLMVNQH